MRVSRARKATAALSILGALPLAGGGLVALVLGLAPGLQLTSTRAVQAASFIHLGLLGWAGAFGLVVLAAVLVRRLALGVLAVPLLAGLVWQGSWVAPYCTADHGPHAASLRLAVINIQNGEGDPDQLVATTADADVLVVIEHSAASRAALADRGITERYAQAVHVDAGVGGTSIYSRFPFDELGSGPTIFGSPAVRVHHPSGPIVVVAVHPVNPMGGARAWLDDAAALRGFVLSHTGEPLVVAGDFNAIDRHATMRPLLTTDGFRSTAEIAGAGFQRTWPTNHPTAPRVIGIDHVLVNDRLTATKHRTFTIPGTDHAGILTDVALRTG